MLEALIAALTTAAGKAAAVAAVSAASVGGLAAAGVVELPDLSDTPAEVTTDDQRETPELPAQSQKGQEAADAKGGNAAIAEEKRQDGKAEGDTETQTEKTDVEAGESHGIGEAVSAAATEGEGPVRDRVLAQTPAADRAAQTGAPEDAGERQDATVRPEQSYQGDDSGEAEAGAEEESDLDDDQGEPAGSAATGDENRGGAAAAGARP